MHDADELKAEVRGVIEVADREYAEANWFCNKCGFYGRAGIEEPGIHSGSCPYLAVKVPSGWAIYNMLAPLRGMVGEDE